MGASIPVAVLTLLGTVVAVLGLFAAGDIRMVVVGLGAVVIAGVLGVLDARTR